MPYCRWCMQRGKAMTHAGFSVYPASESIGDYCRR